MSAVLAEWLERGRVHQRQGRAVDAMLCYRRAAREEPRAMEPRFHLGEVLWQLGRLPDAIALWREAAGLAPDHPAVQMALAEALLGTGEMQGARDIAARRLAGRPNRPHARAIVAVADLHEQKDARAAAAAFVEALAAMPALVGVTAIAGTLARAVDRADPADVAPLLAAIAALDPTPERVASMPATLVAQVIEHVSATPSEPRLAAWLEAARARAWALADHDALRRVAVVDALVQRPGANGALARHYAALCDRAERAVPPLAWPRRTRAHRVRTCAVLLLRAAHPTDSRTGHRRVAHPDR